MTDILLSSTNDISIIDGQLQLIDTVEVLTRQRLLNKLRSFTGTLFTNTDYGIDVNLLFAKNTSTLLDQHLKTLISETEGVISLVSFSSNLDTDRRYSFTFEYQIETGDIVGIKGLTLSLTSRETLNNGAPLWVNGYWDYSGIWDNSYRFGTNGIPVEGDSDGDSFKDIDEVSSGTDPYDYDSFPTIVLKNGSGGYGDLSFWDSAQDIFFRPQIGGLPPMTFNFLVQDNSFISGDSVQVYDGMIQKIKNDGSGFLFTAKVLSSSSGQTVRFSFLEVSSNGVLQNTVTDPTKSLTHTSPNSGQQNINKSVAPTSTGSELYLLVFTDVDAGETLTIKDMTIIN